MKFRDLKSMNEETLNVKEDELRKELIKHRMQISTGTALKSPGSVKKAKHAIARILTELNQRKANAQKGASKVGVKTNVSKPEVKQEKRKKTK